MTMMTQQAQPRFVVLNGFWEATFQKIEIDDELAEAARAFREFEGEGEPVAAIEMLDSRIREAAARTVEEALSEGLEDYFKTVLAWAVPTLRQGGRVFILDGLEDSIADVLCLREQDEQLREAIHAAVNGDPAGFDVVEDHVRDALLEVVDDDVILGVTEALLPVLRARITT